MTRDELIEQIQRVRVEIDAMPRDEQREVAEALRGQPMSPADAIAVLRSRLDQPGDGDVMRAEQVEAKP